jgi:hypothetical protein
VDFTEEQIKITEKEIADSGYRISWYHVRTAKKYLHFKNNRLGTNFNRWDDFLNWESIIIGIFYSIVFVGIIVYKNFYAGTAESRIFEMIAILILLIFVAGFVGIILNGTSAYFAGQRIKREIK